MWEAGELVTFDACVQLVMATVGWVGVGMEVVDGNHTGQSQVLVACHGMPEHFPSEL